MASCTFIYKKYIQNYIHLFASRVSNDHVIKWCGNDPSAGSPTETLLRLHLPLNGKV